MRFIAHLEEGNKVSWSGPWEEILEHQLQLNENTGSITVLRDRSKGKSLVIPARRIIYIDFTIDEGEDRLKISEALKENKP